MYAKGHRAAIKNKSLNKSPTTVMWLDFFFLQLCMSDYIYGFRPQSWATSSTRRTQIEINKWIKKYWQNTYVSLLYLVCAVTGTEQILSLPLFVIKNMNEIYFWNIDNTFYKRTSSQFSFFPPLLHTLHSNYIYS